MFFWINYSYSQSTKTIGKNDISQNNTNSIELQAELITLKDYENVTKIKKESIVLNNNNQEKGYEEISETKTCIKLEKKEDYVSQEKVTIRLNNQKENQENHIIEKPVELILIKRN